MSWASLAYLLASAMFLGPFGRLADIYGRRRVFMYGTLAFSVSALLLGIYPSASTIIMLRALQGISSAMIFGTGVAILVSVTPPKEKGATLGMSAAAVYVGLSVGPYLGGLLINTLGWRSILLVTAGVGAVAVLFMLWRLKGEWKEAGGESFDLKGSLVYSLMLLSLMYGFSLVPTTSSLIPIALGLAGLAYSSGSIARKHPYSTTIIQEQQDVHSRTSQPSSSAPPTRSPPDEPLSPHVKGWRANAG
jgi:MFS family permease